MFHQDRPSRTSRIYALVSNACDEEGPASAPTIPADGDDDAEAGAFPTALPAPPLMPAISNEGWHPPRAAAVPTLMLVSSTFVVSSAPPLAAPRFSRHLSLVGEPGEKSRAASHPPSAPPPPGSAPMRRAA